MARLTLFSTAKAGVLMVSLPTMTAYVVVFPRALWL